MSVKLKKRRTPRRPKDEVNKCDKIKFALQYGTIGFVLFLIGAALTALYLLKSETAPHHLQIAIYLIYGCSALICGILCTARKKTPIIPNCFFAGFIQMLFTVLCALVATKGHFTVFVCIPIALSLVCPILGGIIGKKI